MGRCSIFTEDKNIYHATISKAVKIITEKFDGSFTIGRLTSLQEFTTEEKEYLKEIFSPNIDEVDIWGEHHFHFIKNVWKYCKSDYFDYGKTIRKIMCLLNKSKIPFGTKVYTNDYQLIADLWRAWNTDIPRWDQEHKENYAIIEFMYQNLKNRLGESCRFDFGFIKAFMEAKCDYHNKKINDAILGTVSIMID
ncbi:MAG TPA: hypothetical protein PLV50_06920 [Smithella sp.]|nr:hypothetical protein [Smithella sp.]HOG90252.1 hypothetical protein [Smithella sp.]HOU50557.1 hypothetical protein [Smithella sp.]HQI72207.1 hypothetical protein [Smithella sp.]